MAQLRFRQLIENKELLAFLFPILSRLIQRSPTQIGTFLGTRLYVTLFRVLILL